MPFEKREEVDTETLGEGRPDFTGITKIVKTTGTVINENILGTINQVDNVSQLGTLSQIDTIKNLEAGTINQVGTVQDIESGTISQLKRPIDAGTVFTGTITGNETIGPESITQNLTRQLTVGINTDTAMNVAHELLIGDEWVRDGSDTVPTEGLVTTISHNFAQYRAVRNDGGADGSVSVTYEGRN